MKVLFYNFIVFAILFLQPKNLLAANQFIKYDPNARYCKTEACKLAAYYMAANIERSVHPCDNFYQYACGGFSKRINLTSQESSISTFSIAQLTIRQQLKSNIVKNQNNPKKSKTFKKLQQFYDLCLAQNRKSKLNDEYLKILKESGDWPILVGSSWDESKFNWSRTSLEFGKKGLQSNFLLGLSVIRGIKDNSKRHIIIDQGELGLSEKYLNQGWSNEIVKAYYNYMVSVAVRFKANPSRASKECKEILDFEMKLARISQNESERVTLMKSSNFTTISQLQSEYPFMEWLSYIKSVFHPHVQISSNEQVVLIAPRYYSELGDLLRLTPKRVLANYAYWRVTQLIVGVLGPDIQAAAEDFNEVLTGSRPTYDQHNTCFEYVLQSFPLAMGSLYVRNYVDHSTKPQVRNIFESLRRSLLSVLNEVKWMNSKTRTRALQKLKAMEPEIAYPNELLDDKKIDQYYDSLDIVSGNLLKTSMNINKFANEMAIKSLRQKVNRIDWTKEFGDVTQINAFSDLQANAIIIPAGIMQLFFYDNERPMYLNYGTLGTFIGHEIMHGFDNTGRSFDEYGNVKDWWDSNSANEYSNKVKCIVQQYSNYTVEAVGVHVDGENTQDENIADNGGIKVTYNAYRNWMKKYRSEPKLEGFEGYSQPQLFWLANANAWCQKSRPEQLKQMILFDKHTPFELRVNGALANSKDFARDFNCPPGSPMNPIDKCVIW